MPYSFKDFTGRNLTERKDLNGLHITGSCFSQETPDTHVFPDDMKGVTFERCNLDNVYIPPGNTVLSGSQRRFVVMNDLRDWEIDKDGQPLKVLNEKYWAMQGKSVDPKAIPIYKLNDIAEIAIATAEVANAV